MSFIENTVRGFLEQVVSVGEAIQEARLRHHDRDPNRATLIMMYKQLESNVLTPEEAAIALTNIVEKMVSVGIHLEIHDEHWNPIVRGLQQVIDPSVRLTLTPQKLRIGIQNTIISLLQCPTDTQHLPANITQQALAGTPFADAHTQATRKRRIADIFTGRKKTPPAAIPRNKQQQSISQIRRVDVWRLKQKLNEVGSGKDSSTPTLADFFHPNENRRQEAVKTLQENFAQFPTLQGERRMDERNIIVLTERAIKAIAEAYIQANPNTNTALLFLENELREAVREGLNGKNISKQEAPHQQAYLLGKTLEEALSFRGTYNPHFWHNYRNRRGLQDDQRFLNHRDEYPTPEPRDYSRRQMSDTYRVPLSQIGTLYERIDQTAIYSESRQILTRTGNDDAGADNHADDREDIDREISKIKWQPPPKTENSPPQPAASSSLLPEPEEFSTPAPFTNPNLSTPSRTNASARSHPPLPPADTSQEQVEANHPDDPAKDATTREQTPPAHGDYHQRRPDILPSNQDDNPPTTTTETRPDIATIITEVFGPTIRAGLTIATVQRAQQLSPKHPSPQRVVSQAGRQRKPENKQRVLDKAAKQARTVISVAQRKRSSALMETKAKLGRQHAQLQKNIASPRHARDITKIEKKLSQAKRRQEKAAKLKRIPLVGSVIQTVAQKQTEKIQAQLDNKMSTLAQALETATALDLVEQEMRALLTFAQAEQNQPFPTDLSSLNIEQVVENFLRAHQSLVSSYISLLYRYKKGELTADQARQQLADFLSQMAPFTNELDAGEAVLETVNNSQVVQLEQVIAKMQAVINKAQRDSNQTGTTLGTGSHNAQEMLLDLQAILKQASEASLIVTQAAMTENTRNQMRFTLDDATVKLDGAPRTTVEHATAWARNLIDKMKDFSQFSQAKPSSLAKSKDGINWSHAQDRFRQLEKDARTQQRNTDHPLKQTLTKSAQFLRETTLKVLKIVGNTALMGVAITATVGIGIAKQLLQPTPPHDDETDDYYDGKILPENQSASDRPQNLPPDDDALDEHSQESEQERNKRLQQERKKDLEMVTQEVWNRMGGATNKQGEEIPYDRIRDEVAPNIVDSTPKTGTREEQRERLKKEAQKAGDAIQQASFERTQAFSTARNIIRQEASYLPDHEITNATEQAINQTDLAGIDDWMQYLEHLKKMALEIGRQIDENTQQQKQDQEQKKTLNNLRWGLEGLNLPPEVETQIIKDALQQNIKSWGAGNWAYNQGQQWLQAQKRKEKEEREQQDKEAPDDGSSSPTTSQSNPSSAQDSEEAMPPNSNQRSPSTTPTPKEETSTPPQTQPNTRGSHTSNASGGDYTSSDPNIPGIEEIGWSPYRRAPQQEKDKTAPSQPGATTSHSGKPYRKWSLPEWPTYHEDHSMEIDVGPMVERFLGALSLGAKGVGRMFSALGQKPRQAHNTHNTQFNQELTHPRPNNNPEGEPMVFNRNSRYDRMQPPQGSLLARVAQIIAEAIRALETEGTHSVTRFQEQIRTLYAEASETGDQHILTTLENLSKYYASMVARRKHDEG